MRDAIRVAIGVGNPANQMGYQVTISGFKRSSAVTKVTSELKPNGGSRQGVTNCTSNDAQKARSSSSACTAASSGMKGTRNART